MGAVMDELFVAIKERDRSALERILATDPGAAAAVDASGVSALLTAVYHGNDAAVAAIRAAGVELNVFEAAAVGDVGRVRALVDGDPALARAFAPDGFHPLGLAAFSTTRRSSRSSSRPVPTFRRHRATG
jgi:hypothetical protein